MTDFRKFITPIFLILGLFITYVVVKVTLQKQVVGESGKTKVVAGDFTLQGMHGKVVKLSDYRGKAVLMFFGYTSCPDICPTTMNYLKGVVEKLGKDQSKVQVLFVSFDPRRDKPAILKQYLSHFNPKFMGLTGHPKEIAKVAEQYGSGYIQQSSDSKAGYLYAHTDYVYLIDTKGKLTKSIHQEDSTEQQTAKLVKTIIQKK
ncbi:MAG: protein SCO1/2 [bacterium]|jgi:protein SCO1/2